jgi:hypothetical protein
MDGDYASLDENIGPMAQEVTAIEDLVTKETAERTSNEASHRWAPDRCNAEAEERAEDVRRDAAV